MLLDPGLLLLLALFGGWVTLDGTSVGQFMLSRPLVAASLAGWLAGDAVQGVAVGVMLEAFQLAVLPVGAARYPEAGPAAVVAGAGYATVPVGAADLLVAVAFALVWEAVAGESVRRLRQTNIGLAAVAGGSDVTAREIERRHLVAILLDFLRGAVLVVAGSLLLSVLLDLVRGVELPGGDAADTLMRFVLAALLASSVALFAGRMRLFIAGAVGGILLLLVRP